MANLRYTSYGIIPRLPRELEEMIFVLAVTSHPSSWDRLVQVAARVREWVKPYQYRTLVDTSYSPSYDLERYGCRVRNILLRSLSTLEARRIIECCPNVTNIALWLPCSPNGLLYDLPHLPPLTHLSGDIEALFENNWPPFDLPLLQSITHLEVTGLFCDWQKWEHTVQLPKLSHLAIAGEYSNHAIIRVLETLPNLQTLIIQSGAVLDNAISDSSTIPSDPRLIFRVVADGYEEWYACANGRQSFWDREEQVHGVELSA